MPLVPIIEYPVTVGGVVIATASSEAAALKFIDRLTDAAAGLALAGPVGFGPSQRVAEVADLASANLDLTAMAAAYDAAESERRAKAEPEPEPARTR